MRHLPRIVIDVIPHKRQRYDTTGDYYETLKNNWLMRISEMDRDREFLVALHELVEWYLAVVRKGIKEEDISKFDIEFGHDDPGSLPDAPYHEEHMIAEDFERKMAEILGIDWDEYTAAFDDLEYRRQESADETIV